MTYEYATHIHADDEDKKHMNDTMVNGGYGLIRRPLHPNDDREFVAVTISKVDVINEEKTWAQLVRDKVKAISELFGRNVKRVSIMGNFRRRSDDELIDGRNIDMVILKPKYKWITVLVRGKTEQIMDIQPTDNENYIRLEVELYNQM